MSVETGNDADTRGGVEARELLRHGPGSDGKETVGQLYVIAPGTVLPWHIHPGAEEISYILEGTFTVEVEGQAPQHLHAGDTFYVGPDVKHRGSNRSDRPFRLFVVRIKPVDQPLVVEVPAP